MRKVFKWIGILLGGVFGLFLIVAAGVYFSSQARLARTFSVPEEEINFESDEAIITHGEHVAATRGCFDCHGTDLGGDLVFDEPALATIYAPNLTSGEGGVGSSYTDAEFARAIRHGVRADGSGLLVMPSEEYFVLSEPDISSLVAYIRSVAPVDRQVPSPSLTILGRTLYMVGQLPPAAAETIDHSAPHPEAPGSAPNAAYGEYLATGCTGCHGKNLAGGRVPGMPPGFPPSANLTPASNLANWGEARFIQTLRSGITPEGKVLDPDIMPWTLAAQMTELELKALWAYLQSLPPIE
jgi:mono/diheme cytochrome c family protein